jgi:hypothetical protein
MIRGSSPGRGSEFLFSPCVQVGSGAHPVSYPMGTRHSFLGHNKWQEREADHSSPSSAEVKECVELYPHSPDMPSWHSAQLKHRDNFTFTFYTERVEKYYYRATEMDLANP